MHLFVRLGFRLLVRLSVFVALSASGAAFSHDFNFHHYTARHGLPQTQVLAIHQDATGYLWVGTYGGLGRYNGRAFDVFSTNEGLSSNTIGAISHDASGRVWAGTTNGLCYLPEGRERFECLGDSVLANANVRALLPDDEDLWVGTSNGLFRLRFPEGSIVAESTVLDDSSVTSLALGDDGAVLAGTHGGLFRLQGDKPPEEIRLPRDSANQVTALLRTQERLWIGSETGLYMLDTGRVRRVESAGQIDRVNALAVGHDGAVWIASNKGVLRMDSKGNDLLTTFNGLMTDINFTVFVDREGIVWLGNDDGLTKFVPGAFVGYREKHGLLHYFVRTLNEDGRERLWLGTREGAQIVPYRNGEWQFDAALTITAEDGLADPRVYSIAFPAQGEALLATGGGVARWREGEGIIETYTREDGLPINTTQALKIEGQRVWIGTNLGVTVLENGQIKPAPDAALAQAYVYRIVEDTHGRLWFGSQDHGLFVRAPDGRITRLGKAQGLTDETIWDLAPDSQGGIWVGTNGDGLFHIAAGGDIRRFTVADGLVDNFIWQVLVDDQQRVWTYTNRGISRFDGERFENYGAEDGLLHLEGGATGALQTHDGQLWFASADGLMRYNPRREYSNDLPPPVVIENVLRGGNEISPGERLAYEAGSVDIQYAALSFQSEPQLRYQYRLRGAGEDWSEPVPYRPITYANLGGGNYEFEVRAQNPDGVWSVEPARFSFSVSPPIWERPWFWLLIVLLAALLAWLLFRMRIRQVEARRRELEGIVAERTRELEVANEKLQTASVTDPLTGLHNRRFLTSQIRTDVAQSRRAYRGPSVYPNRDIVFMMIDLDHFKEINDTYGHGAGDRVLRQYAQILEDQIRESDYVVRWGGEEFLVVARQAESSQCNVIADRIIREVRGADFVITDDGSMIKCTCSIGVSHFPFLRQSPDSLSWEQIIDIADTAVYLAKALGRDGWVSIQGTEKMEADSGAVIMRWMRDDLAYLVESGRILIDGSFQRVAEAAVEDWMRRHPKG